MRKEMMDLSDDVRHQIRESLKPLHPEKVIVFGSYARAEADRDSDIDLIVVLDSDTMPTTYHERRTNRLLVRRALDALNRDYALDVLVYTAAEWKRFQDSGNASAKEVGGRRVALRMLMRHFCQRRKPCCAQI